MTQSNVQVTAQVRRVSLETGVLTVAVSSADLPLDDLIDFGSRRNPKRGFLMVSNVMGKHKPSKPSTMRDIYRRLAQKIPNDLPGPVLFVGLAETAICLGQGTFEEYSRLTGRSDLLFIHTTRYRFESEEVAVEFKEEHCHAPDHIVYQPVDPHHRELFATASSIVFVDDEVTTGMTFLNLTRAFKALNPGLQTAHACVITDWRTHERRITLETASTLPVHVVSLLSGEALFKPAESLQLVEMPKAVGNGGDKSELIQGNHGRFGMTTPPDLKAQALALNIATGSRCLVLGTGEFAYVPFLLAEQLEQLGVNVFCQSTTRSPAMVSGALGCALAFTDNYGDGIANYVYNVDPAMYDVIVLCHETSAEALDADMLESLNGPIVLEF